MAKVSPIKLNFNAGEYAVTVEGRVDLDRHPASMRVMKNAIAAPQGPCIRRSGTVFQGPVYDHTKISGLIAFVFSDEQAQMLEFADQRIRFMDEDGFQTYTPVSITDVIDVAPFKFTSAALATQGAVVGDEIILDGFSPSLNVTGRIAKITAKSGNDYTVDTPYDGPTGPQVGKTASWLYKIASPFLQADVRNIVAVQSVDVLYLFCKGYRTRTLSRYGAYDWRIANMSFVDGPFETDDPDEAILTPDVTGQALGVHTSNTAASPDTGDFSGSDENAGAGHQQYRAADYDKDTYWESSTNQTGILTYIFAAPTVIEGYVLEYQSKNDSSSDANKDNLPSTWTFEGRFTAGAWVVLDEQIEYSSFKNLRSQYIKMNQKTAYNEYRLNIRQCVQSGSRRPRLSQFVLRKAGDVFINLTANSTSKINRDQGFLSTDVGRLIRIRQGDGFWRSVEITTVTDATHITVKLQDEPLYDTEPIRRWRLGSFSDTTGWPTCGAFFRDRLVCGGPTDFPTLIAASKVGAYETFSPTDPDGTVLDDNAISSKLNSRTASPVRWLVGDKSGLLIGTGNSEWTLTEGTTAQAFSARNQKAEENTARGSAAIQPVKIDRQVIFVQASRRTIREYAYDFQSDGFKSPSMSLFAPHLGVPPFAQMAYAAEPHSIIWFRRDDGSIAGLTYQRDEGVTGWHRHDFGGAVESIAVIPNITDAQDTLWMVIRRTIDGQTRRYIERLSRFWDFDSTLDTSHFVDCGLRLDLTAPTDMFYGLTHLEGENVCGLADGVPFGITENIVVTDGAIQLPFMAEEYIVVGLQYETFAETQRPNEGAADGTAQGKTARTNQVVPFVWDSAGGEIGMYNEDQRQNEFMNLEYPYMAAEPLTDRVELTTGMLDIHTMPAIYSVRKTLLFRQTWPLPFNVIALMPQTTVQDR